VKCVTQVHLYLWENYNFPCTAFQETLKSEHHFVHISYTKCHPNQTINVESVCRNCVHPISTYVFHFTDFSETHSHSVNICGYQLYQISSEPNKEIYKMWTKFYLSPYVKCGCHFTNFYETVTVEQLFKNSYTK
jgi:hypothetical protein